MITILNLKDAPQHLQTLAQLHQNEWSHFNPGETLQQRIQRMRLFFNTSFVPSTFIATDKNLLGSAAIVTNDMKSLSSLSPWLASVYVEPNSRCRGTGTLLVQHVMQQAKSNGVDILYLFTPDKVNFYERLGWKVIDNKTYCEQEVAIMQVNLGANKI